jgi:hypothetical protein
MQLPPLVSLSLRTSEIQRIESASAASLINPLPKFSIGQRVQSFWLSDESGYTYWEAGFIVGMVLNPDDWNIPGWIYWVCIEQHPDDPDMVGCQEEILESDLQLW